MKSFQFTSFSSSKAVTHRNLTRREISCTRQSGNRRRKTLMKQRLSTAVSNVTITCPSISSVNLASLMNSLDLPKFQHNLMNSFMSKSFSSLDISKLNSALLPRYYIASLQLSTCSKKWVRLSSAGMNLGFVFIFYLC